MKKILLFFIALAISTPLIIAQDHKYCGHEMVTEQLKNSIPDYDARFYKMIDEAQKQGAQLKQGEQDLYTIQVVVHVLYERNNKYQNIPDSIILSQIEALNRDFRKNNGDTSKIRDIFKDIATDVGINFVLASKDPQNQPTNGITRKKWGGTTLVGPLADPFLKTSALGGQSAWQTQRYLNIWVCDLNKGHKDGEGFLGGYAFPPPGLPDWPEVSLGNPGTDGIVIDYRFFGQNNHVALDIVEPVAVVNNMGRTTVHETGHYLGLRHIWGDLGTLIPELGCAVDDGIDDTPNAQVPTGGGVCYRDSFPNSCDEGVDDKPDMFENYMDYSGDACNAMFTKRQAELMRWVLTTRRSNVILKTVEAEPLLTQITGCKGDSVTLEFTNTREDYSYFWNGTQDEFKISFLLTKDTTFEVEVSNAFDSKTFIIEVKTIPTLVNSAIADFNYGLNEGLAVSFNPVDTSKTSYLWNFGDGNTSVEKRPSHIYQVEGNYTVNLYIPNVLSCDTFFFEKVLEVENTATANIDLINKYGISVFPNPTSNEINIRIEKGQLSNNRLRIIDATGKQVVEKINFNQNDRTTISVKNLAAGYYYIELDNSDEKINIPFIKK